MAKSEHKGPLILIANEWRDPLNRKGVQGSVMLGLLTADGAGQKRGQAG